MNLLRRGPAAVLAAGALCALGLAPATALASPASNPTATPSLGGANLISYTDSDFEGSIGDWVSVSNSTLSNDTSHALLHNDSLLAVAGTAGTQQFKLGASAGQVNVTGGDSYKISAWFKVPALSGRTVSFALGFYTSGGTWLGWTNGPTQTLNNGGHWQYASAVITAPATAGYAYGSPRVTETGVTAGETLNMDEVLFTPARAATLIGAEGASDSATDWNAANNTIGPLQSNKIFYSPSQTLPSSYSGSLCAGLPAGVTCVISFKDFNDPHLSGFVSTIPASRPVIMVFYQEPENPDVTWSYHGLTGGPAFVAEFEQESSAIRAAANGAPNVFVAMDARGYQYGSTSSNHHLGTSCSFIPPPQYVDAYLDDQYEPTSSGNNLAADPTNNVLWNNWLSCVTPNNKPLGLAEYGLNCNGANPNPNAATTPQAMAADNTYLAGQPNGLPVMLWEYWWNATGTCQFTSSQAISEWKAIETQNGGGAN